MHRGQHVSQTPEVTDQTSLSSLVPPSLLAGRSCFSKAFIVSGDTSFPTATADFKKKETSGGDGGSAQAVGDSGSLGDESLLEELMGTKSPFILTLYPLHCASHPCLLPLKGCPDICSRTEPVLELSCTD